MPDSGIAVPFLLTHNVSVLDFTWVRKSHITSNRFKDGACKYQLVRENNFSLSFKLLFGVCFPV